MRILEIEAWALSIVDRLRMHQLIEDDRVELKAGWQEPKRIARQLAGHANAAHGEPILWLIGVDEKSRTVVGADYEEFSNWFQAVRAEFDEFAPEVQTVNVKVDDKTIVALLFETQRFPYVVKNPAFNKEKGEAVSREVPWREGTSTISARHSHLVRMLAPLQRLPSIEVLHGRLLLYGDRLRKDAKDWVVPNWTLTLELYIVPRSGELVLPVHRAVVAFEIPGYCTTRQVESLSFEAPTGGFVTKTLSEAIIQGPGRLNLSAHVTEAAIPADVLPLQVPGAEALITIHLLPADSDVAAVHTSTLPRQDLSEDSKWWCIFRYR